MNRSHVGKLLRRAHRFAKIENNPSSTPEQRALAAAGRVKMESAILQELYNPHAAKNAEIESRRALQMLNRKSTDGSNRERRIARARHAEVEAHRLAHDSAAEKQRALDIIDLMMGRKKVEDLTSKSQDDQVAAT